MAGALVILILIWAVKSLINGGDVAERVTRLSLGECIVTTPKHVKLVKIYPPEETQSILKLSIG